jgi:hypothetical protein
MMSEHTRTATLLVLLGVATGLACGGNRTPIRAGGSGGSGGGGSRATGGTTGGASTVASGGTTSASGGTTPASGGTTDKATGGAGGGMSGTDAAGTGGTTAGTGGTSTGTVWPALGEPCSVPGQQSACATVDADPCLSCWGHWLICSNGAWRETHCDPRPAEPPPDAAPTIDVAPDERRPIDTAPAETAIDGPAVLRG